MRLSPRAAVLLAAVLAAGLSPAASGSTTSTVQQPFKQEWSYTFGSGAGDAFASPDFDPVAAGWSTGSAPFFKGTYLCTFDRSSGGTSFPIGSTLLLRREVVLPAGAQDVRVRGTIDNDADVFWNGVRLGRVRNGDCLTDGIDLAVPPELVTGSDVLAVRAIDHGVISYFDATVAYGAPTDVTPPTIAATVTPPPNALGWNDGPVTYEFTCADDVTVASCSPGGSFTTEGVHDQVTGTAVDGAGRTATADVGPVRIDLTGPVVTFTGVDRTYAVDETVTVTCEASDALSGVAADDCAGQAVERPAYELAPGEHTVTATATDRAGNTVTSSAVYTVAAADEAAIGRLASTFVDQPGVAAALLGKLDAAAAAPTAGARDGALRAFEQQVRAQTGKSLTAEEADVLLRLVAGG